MSTRKGFEVAIVGGGIGGVALAVGLLRRGISFQIFEAAPKLAELGAGIAFGPNAIRAMALIDPAIKASFDELATKNKAGDEEETWINFRCGMEQPSLIAKIQTRDDAKTGLSSVHRAHFLEALASKVPTERFRFNKRLIDIESGTTTALLLRFEDGTTKEVDALVGCDGIRSKCRQLMLERQSVLEDLSFTKKYVYRGLVAMEKAKAVLGASLSENSQMYLGPGGHVLTYPIEGGSMLNVVAFRDKCDGIWKHDRWVLQGQAKQMRADFVGWGKPVQDVLATLEDVDMWALFDLRPIPSYHKGFIALLGDAAHATTPHQGAGAGQALEDALILGTLLEKDNVHSVSDIPAIFKVYSQVRKDRSQKVVATSRAIGETYAFQGPSGSNVKAMREDLLQQFQWIWQESMDAQVELARKLLGDLM